METLQPKLIHTILIANRGEIASRIIRTCRRLGIRSIAVFSDADRNWPYVKDADAAVYIGESTPAKSYLNQDKIIEAALGMGADAIHPGYGFLAENASFARRCAEEGIVFIGPNPASIAAMGSKSAARELMIQHQVPVVPGYQGEDQSEETLRAEATRIGYPVLLKAVAGGGGKGMRIANSEAELSGAIHAAQSEAERAFGDGGLILEKYIASGRHIEFQIFGDRHGNIIHLNERECTIQRRYQKVMEESPSPVLTDELRAKMGLAAVKAAQALSYDNAGTVEFIFDDTTGAFYFLEVNTRLQVEHPVTEAVTGLDLVEMQIESAQGFPLKISQEEVQSNGYALECRLYAEDPENHFLPATGHIYRFEYPELSGLRMENAVQSGTEISTYYDPMIAKIIVHDKDRQLVIRKMRYVLSQMICLGTITNQYFLKKILEHPDFQSGTYNTHFIEEKLLSAETDGEKEVDLPFFAIVACLKRWAKREKSRRLLRSIPSGWRNSFYDFQQEEYQYRGEALSVRYRYLSGVFIFLVGEEEFRVSLISESDSAIEIETDGIRYNATVIQDGADIFNHHPEKGSIRLTVAERFPGKEKTDHAGGYTAPMPSTVVRIPVKEGQKVAKGDVLVVLSSMKMENSITAGEDGTVGEIYASEGASIKAGFVLLEMKK